MRFTVWAEAPPGERTRTREEAPRCSSPSGRRRLLEGEGEKSNSHNEPSRRTHYLASPLYQLQAGQG